MLYKLITVTGGDEHSMEDPRESADKRNSRSVRYVHATTPGPRHHEGLNT